MRHLFLAATVALSATPAYAVPHGHRLQQTRSATDDRLANEHYKTGWELLGREQWDDSAREFQSAIDLSPRFKLAYYGLGRARMGGKHFGEAITAYEACRGMYLAQASQNFANRADAERIIADDIRQIDMTISRLSGNPATVAAQNAQLNMMKQRLQNQLRNSDSMSLSASLPPFISLALGSAYLRANRFRDAEQAYGDALQADPKYGEAHSNLAALYLITGRFDDAAKEVAAAEKIGFKVNPGLKDEIKKKQGGG